MSGLIVKEYDKILIGTLKIDSQGNVSNSMSYFNRGREYKHKLACFLPTGRGVSLASCFIEGKLRTWPSSDWKRVYISSDCRTPRDLIRNSGYKIVRDASAAQMTVIPALEYNTPKLYYDLLAYDSSDKSLMLFTVNRWDNIASNSIYNTDEYVFEKLKEFLLGFKGNIEIYQTDIKDKAIVQFLPKYKEYREILDEMHSGRIYVSETRLKIDAPTKISVETLTVWKNYSDFELLAKSICNSDWKDYPITLLVFLSIEFPTIYLYGGDAMKLVLKQIGFERYSSLNGILKDREVTPKDWDMLQDYIMSLLGISGNGGFVSFAKMREESEYERFIKRKMAVGTIRIDTPQLISNFVKL